jgi:radical SAM superfamily enzyme YgiQ (UPF0313 family)
MQVNLVLGPPARTCPPLGIALIKSNIEQNSHHRVRCFDLNCAFQNAIDDEIRKEDGKINIVGHDKDLFTKAVDVLRGDTDFFEQQAFHESTKLFIGYFDNISDTFRDACKNALLKNAPTPWPVPQSVNLLLSNKPDVVGFSIMFPEQFYFSALAARMLKAANAKIRIVFGGHSISGLYEETLKHTFADFVVMNEGEKAFLELLDALDGKMRFEDVPNLVFRKNDEVRVNKSSLISKLDKLPFADFSDLDLGSYFMPSPVVPVLTSRGCYWRRCAFCVHHKSYLNTYRQRTVAHVVDELQYHVNHGVTHFVFVDEMISAARFKQISEEIIRRKLPVYYYALGKPTADFTKDVLELMYESGCRYVIWGLESGCQRVLDLIDKGTKVTEMGRVLHESASAGLKNHVFVIVGFPSETKEELFETLEFFFDNKDVIHAVHSSSFGLHKGSLIYDNPEKYGITQVGRRSEKSHTIKYEVSHGIKHDEVKSYVTFYSDNYFTHFAGFSDYVVRLRDHALLLYSNADKLIYNMDKKAVPLPEDVETEYEAGSQASREESPKGACRNS